MWQLQEETYKSKLSLDLVIDILIPSPVPFSRNGPYGNEKEQEIQAVETSPLIALFCFSADMGNRGRKPP
jgi:hypothetical protein